MITCQICHREFTAITNTHLKKHNLTSIADYLKLHPGAKTVSDDMHEKLSKNSKAFNAARDYSTLGAKISATKQKRKEEGKDYGAGIRGIKRSDEQKQALSDYAKQAYASGDRKHWNLGKTVNDTSKQKISESLKAFAAPAVAARLEIKLAEELKLKELKQYQLEEAAKQLNQTLALKNIVLLENGESLSKFKCLSCSTNWELTSQYLDASRRDKILCRTCNPKLTTSKQELEVYQFVKSLCEDAIQSDRKVLGGRELDILVESKKVAFEFNGLYWHSELVRGIPKHLLWKQQHAYKLGYRLFHIFDDEWEHKQELVKDKIKAILGKLEYKLDARKMAIVNLSNAEKHNFLIENHLQGDDVAGIRYGLKDSSGKIVACATFKRTSYIKGGDGEGFELSRFATLRNHSVRGGASKLLKVFLQEYKPSKLISYADRRWSFGSLYDSIGFRFDSFSMPSYWYMKGYKNRTHRSAFMKHELVAQGHDASKSEWEIMQDLGYDRIWDCGTLKYVYEA